MANLKAPIMASLLMVILASGGIQAQAPSAASGHWEGTIDIPGQPLAITVDLKPKNATAWDGTITIPAQNIKGFPLATITVKENAVGFAMSGVPGEPRFKGTLDAKTGTLAGDFMQGNATMPFKLTRKGDAKFELPPKSTAVSRELEGTWEGSLDVKAAVLRLVLKLANQNGAATGSIISVDQGAAVIPIASITESAGKLSLVLPTIGASFEGSLKNGELAGTWTQGQGSLPLVFKRSK